MLDDVVALIVMPQNNDTRTQLASRGLDPFRDLSLVHYEVIFYCSDLFKNSAHLDLDDCAVRKVTQDSRFGTRSKIKS
jgi:hypothetical protein